MMTRRTRKSTTRMKNKGISLLPHPACLPHLHGAVLVGLSGGRDSVALLHVLLQQGCCVHACHVHHGIRGAAADADAEFCRTLCERLKVPFEQHRINVPALAETRRVSLETAARSARRELLAAAAARCGTNCVALAHHADDQAETVLFRLARGAAGYRGMQPIHAAQGILWLRPLLEYTRSDITHYLEAMGESWVEDATNAVADVARNRIRLEVLPALNRALERDVAPILNRSAAQQADTLAALAEALDLLSLTDPQGRLYLPALADRSPAFRRAVLHHYLTRAGVPGLTHAHICAVDAILPPDSPGHSVNLPGGYRAVRRQKRLLVENPALINRKV